MRDGYASDHGWYKTARRSRGVFGERRIAGVWHVSLWSEGKLTQAWKATRFGAWRALALAVRQEAGDPKRV